MSTKSKSGGRKMTAKEKKQAQMAANRRAQLQWYAVGGLFVVIVVVVVIVISIYTEGEIFSIYGS